MPEFKYDVCLSFAGEDREYVEAVASYLRAAGVAVFYDRYHETDLWGKNLYEHLSRVYRDEARYCVMFISQHYAAKLWTSHERRSAQERAFRESEDYILPVRFDDTEVPGLATTTGYLDIQSRSAKDLASLIVAKVKLSVIPATPAPQVPLDVDVATSSASTAARADEWDGDRLVVGFVATGMGLGCIGGVALPFLTPLNPIAIALLVIGGGIVGAFTFGAAAWFSRGRLLTLTFMLGAFAAVIIVVYKNFGELGVAWALCGGAQAAALAAASIGGSLQR